MGELAFIEELEKLHTQQLEEDYEKELSKERDQLHSLLPELTHPTQLGEWEKCRKDLEELYEWEGRHLERIKPVLCEPLITSRETISLPSERLPDMKGLLSSSQYLVKNIGSLYALPSSRSVEGGEELEEREMRRRILVIEKRKKVMEKRIQKFDDLLRFDYAPCLKMSQMEPDGIMSSTPLH